MSTRAFAQGGGASTTGSINGRVADSSNAVLPGVTVTTSSPSLMGVQSTVTDSSGNYRFPALPPGTYTVTFELPGFTTLKRENIQIALGFQATINAELQVAALQETVTVTGDSPVIDTSNTRVQQNFKLEALREIPNSRDMWSLLAVTPSVTMARIDVGGNRAGTQTTYSAYGYNGQARVLIENINTTEGTSGAGFYFDFGSFEEAYVGTIAQGAEMPTPGVQSNFLGKSGGNRFQGEVYKDFETNGLQSDNIASNLPPQFAYNPATNPTGIRDHSNELQKYNDFNLNVGGPIKKDKIWGYFSYRYQATDVGQPNFVQEIAGTPFHTDLWNPSGKVTWQINQNNKLIGYYQWGQKAQPNRLPNASLLYNDLSQTLAQTSASWVYKGEWNGTLSNNMYAEARYGVFGYYFPLVSNLGPTDTGTNPEIWDTGTSAFVSGGDQLEQTDRRRRQYTGALTYFKDGWGGTHNFKVGAEYLVETGWYGSTQLYSGDVRETFVNGAPSNVRIGVPTATSVNTISPSSIDGLTSIDALQTTDFFGTDQYAIGRATINAGVRFDHYRSYSPIQNTIAFAYGPVNVPAQTYPETTYATFNNFAPRIGVSYDLMGDGKTVLKANYGLYWFNPGPGLASNANENQAAKFVQYQWRPANCNYCVYQPGQEGTVQSTALQGTTTVDPSLVDPHSNQFTAFVERQLTEGVGLRAGYSYLSVVNQFGTFQPSRPISAYTVPFNVTDPFGNTDTYYGIPNAAIAAGQFPANNVVANAPDNGYYKTLEVSVNKRMSKHYSIGGGYNYTWLNDYPVGYPNTPNSPGQYSYTNYAAKLNAQVELPWTILLSAVYRFQSGQNYAAQYPVSAPASCACTFSAGGGGQPGGQSLAAAPSISATNVYLTPYNAYRMDNISVFDLRGEKTINLPANTKLRLFIDGYNLFNNYAAETIVFTAGSTFQQPTAILGPRTGRIGFRFIWG
ncbi:MAG TPA: carboxypeptidase regulatory-like domain-containing protein [Vicinamibacterales bacterium]